MILLLGFGGGGLIASLARSQPRQITVDLLAPLPAVPWKG
jgi:hypothetical protein